MSTVAEDIEELRKALNLGPTPGPWNLDAPIEHRGTEVKGPLGVSMVWCGESSIYGSDGTYRITTRESYATASWIVAANPERILRLLDHLEALQETKP